MRANRPACVGTHILSSHERIPGLGFSYCPSPIFIMTISTKTRMLQGAELVKSRKQDMKELLTEIEFHTGSWQDLQAYYKKNHDRELKQSGLTGYSVVWINYKDKTIFAQTRRMYEDDDIQNDFMYRIILNALGKMAATYNLLELYEFARYGNVLSEHLEEIGILKKVE